MAQRVVVTLDGRDDHGDWIGPLLLRGQQQWNRRLRTKVDSLDIRLGIFPVTRLVNKGIGQGKGVQNRKWHNHAEREQFLRERVEQERRRRSEQEWRDWGVGRGPEEWRVQRTRAFRAVMERQ